MLSPTATYIACLFSGVGLLLASYPLHAATCYWTGLSMIVATVLLPNLGEAVSWFRKNPQPPRND